MLLSTGFVPVREINSPVPRSNFAEVELEQAAELILQAEGIINPLILRQKSLEAYEVVDGHFEFYAAVKAREIDARRGEMIGAFVLTRENQNILEAQVKVLRKANASSVTIQPEAKTEIGVLEFEKILEQKLEIAIAKIQNYVDGSFSKIEQLLAKPIQPKPVAVGAKNYNNMTVIQLKQQAKQRNISLPAKAKKAEIVARLKQADGIIDPQ